MRSKKYHTNRVAVLGAALLACAHAGAGVLLDNGSSTPSRSNATFLSIVPGGIGHQLVVPYFTAQSGNATLLQVVNTDAVNGKAVKVRFRGGLNADAVMDFHLFLAPNGSWSATVSQDAYSGLSTIFTPDHGCTMPSINGAQFLTARLPQAANGWSEAERAEQTREGYIEMVTMADIPPKAIDPGSGAPRDVANRLFTTIASSMDSGGSLGCAALGILVSVDEPVSTPDAYARGLRAPSGTLFADWTIIDVPRGGAATGEAVAIVAQTIVPDPNGIAPQGIAASALGNIVYFPPFAGEVGASRIDAFTADPALRTLNGSGTGGLDDGVTMGDPANTGYANPVAAGGTGKTLPAVMAQLSDLPDLSTPYLSNATAGASAPLRQAELLSRSLATTQLINEFLTSTDISANTDWVFTMPTRRFSVAMDYRGSAKAGSSILTPPTAAYTRFGARDYYLVVRPLDTPPLFVGELPTTGNTTINGFQVCVRPVPGTGPQAAREFLYYDREERVPADNGAFPAILPSPRLNAPGSDYRFCGVTSLLLWNAQTGGSVLGGTVAASNVNTAYGGITFREGWARMPTPGLSSISGYRGIPTGNGLPILGRAFIRANAGGRMAAGGNARFGGSWSHRTVPPVTP